MITALALGMLLAAGPTPGPPDGRELLDVVSGARRALAGLQGLWGIDGRDVQWIFASAEGSWATRREDRREVLVPVALPPGTLRANTAVELEGRRWAMVVLPLPGDGLERVRLLVHEATHTFQPERLPRPGPTEPGDGGDLLEGPQARTWLFLELRALAAALEARGAARAEAASDALVFRARRDALAHPAERARLDALDLAEGLPEYTGWKLSRTPIAVLTARLRAAPDRPAGWVRWVAYDTGPAYALLLDALGARWRAAARGGARLPDLLALSVGAAGADADARGERYGKEAIAAAEASREAARARRLADLRARFVEGLVLRILPGALQLSFDPGRQTPLGEDGTVMGGLRWASTDGAVLEAPDGALVSPAWDFVQVPLGEVSLEDGPLPEARTLEGPGWRLTLPAGWRVAREGSRVRIRPP
jgi:hypothetical protein